MVSTITVGKRFVLAKSVLGGAWDLVTPHNWAYYTPTYSLPVGSTQATPPISPVVSAVNFNY